MVQGEDLAARARVPLLPALLGMALHQFHFDSFTAGRPPTVQGG